MLLPPDYNGFKSLLLLKDHETTVAQAKKRYEQATDSLKALLDTWDENSHTAALEQCKILAQECLSLCPSSGHAESVYQLIKQLPDITTLQAFYAALQEQVISKMEGRLSAGSRLLREIRPSLLSPLEKALSEEATRSQTAFTAAIDALKKANERSSTFENEAQIKAWVGQARMAIGLAFSVNAPDRVSIDTLKACLEQTQDETCDPALVLSCIQTAIGPHRSWLSLTPPDWITNLQQLRPCLEGARDRFNQYTAELTSADRREQAIQTLQDKDALIGDLRSECATQAQRIVELERALYEASQDEEKAALAEANAGLLARIRGLESRLEEKQTTILTQTSEISQLAQEVESATARIVPLKKELRETLEAWSRLQLENQQLRQREAQRITELATRQGKGRQMPKLSGQNQGAPPLVGEEPAQSGPLSPAAPTMTAWFNSLVSSPAQQRTRPEPDVVVDQPLRHLDSEGNREKLKRT